MTLHARWLEPATIERLRRLVIDGDTHAIRAARCLERYRQTQARTAARRFHKRAFERHAERALGERP